MQIKFTQFEISERGIIDKLVSHALRIEFSCVHLAEASLCGIKSDPGNLRLSCLPGVSMGRMLKIHKLFCFSLETLHLDWKTFFGS